MVEAGVVLEVSSVDCELIESVELAFQTVVRAPDVAAGALKDVHSVVHGGTVECAVLRLLWWWFVAVWVGGEDDVP